MHCGTYVRALKSPRDGGMVPESLFCGMNKDLHDTARESEQSDIEVSSALRTYRMAVMLPNDDGMAPENWLQQMPKSLREAFTESLTAAG